MEIREMQMSDIEERLSQIDEELNIPDANIDALKDEITALEERKNTLKAEIEERKAKMDAITVGTEPTEVIKTFEEERKTMSCIEERANQFVADGRLEMRQLLSSGVLTPTAVKETIGELPTVVSSIIDDVNVIDVEGNGSYAFSYRITDAEAADVTEGSAVSGTPGTFKKDGAINPTTWGVLDEISNSVALKTPIKYMESIQSNAYLALRRKAKDKVTKAIVDSTIAQTVAYALNENYLRDLVLGYDSDESVAEAKLYICKEDLATLGHIRGTNDKKPVYEITYTDANNGIIKEGGLAVPFSINASLKAAKATKNVQIYGDPKAVTLALWGNYEVKTDEGGDYFKRNMIGIRGLQTAGAEVTRKNGIQVVGNEVG